LTSDVEASIQQHVLYAWVAGVVVTDAPAVLLVLKGCTGCKCTCSRRDFATLGLWVKRLVSGVRWKSQDGSLAQVEVARRKPEILSWVGGSGEYKL